MHALLRPSDACARPLIALTFRSPGPARCLPAARAQKGAVLHHAERVPHARGRRRHRQRHRGRLRSTRLEGPPTAFQPLVGSRWAVVCVAPLGSQAIQGVVRGLLAERLGGRRRDGQRRDGRRRRRVARLPRFTVRAPHCGTPWDPSRWPAAAGGAAARGCRARTGGAHPAGTPPAPPALGLSPLPIGPRGACADRRPLLSRCSRAAGTA